MSYGVLKSLDLVKWTMYSGVKIVRTVKWVYSALNPFSCLLPTRSHKVSNELTVETLLLENEGLGGWFPSI